MSFHKSNPRIYTFTTCKTQESHIIRELHITRVMYTQKTHFYGISGHVQTLVSSGKFYLTEIPFQRCRNEVNGVTKLNIWVLQDRCFFSDFHEVPTCDEIMEKWSQEEMCHFGI